MKKLFNLSVCLLMCISLIGCSSQNQEADNAPQPVQTQEQGQTDHSKKRWLPFFQEMVKIIQLVT